MIRLKDHIELYFGLHLICKKHSFLCQLTIVRCLNLELLSAFSLFFNLFITGKLKIGNNYDFPIKLNFSLHLVCKKYSSFLSEINIVIFLNLGLLSDAFLLFFDLLTNGKLKIKNKYDLPIALNFSLYLVCKKYSFLFELTIVRSLNLLLLSAFLLYFNLLINGNILSFCMDLIGLLYAEICVLRRYYKLCTTLRVYFCLLLLSNLRQ